MVFFTSQQINRLLAFFTLCLWCRNKIHGINYLDVNLCGLSIFLYINLRASVA
ncbi:hypothetical protein YE105_C0652 [Yersinia enterocolitica subsp. palearctica 105.5R(r)]|nr:hypothetical protein YE105_C0652 [Yersinia enterocolitica subsp. palearctica 105.5R(r)]